MGKHGDLADAVGRETEKSGETQEQSERASEEPTKRLNANVPESLHRAVRMKTVMVEALTEYLPSYPNE